MQDDVQKLRAKTDDELLQLRVGNLPDDRMGVAAGVILEIRNTGRLAESIRHLEKFAASTEASGKRMEWATYIILIATLVQLVLTFLPMMHGK
jgi:hypothetical protein